MGEGATKKIKIDPKLALFALIAVIGILLLVFSGFISDKEDGEEQNADNVALDPTAYSEKVESEIERLCASVAEGRSVEAVVSLAGGYRSVYATDSQSNSSGYKSSMVLVGNGSSEGAVLVCYENPEISGVGIVLSGKEDEGLKNSVIYLISAAFNVKTNKIHVAFGG